MALNDNTLLLRIRAEALSANFGRLRTNLLATPKRLKELQDLDTLLAKVADDIRASRLTTLEMEKDATPPLSGHVEKLEQQLQAAKTRLNDAKGLLVSLRNACFHVTATPVAGTLTTNLDTSINPLIERANGVATNLGNADYPTLWKWLNATRSDAAPPVLDYVELMGGVALRDAGFDEGVSALADELLRAYIATGDRPNFLAIPMRDQAFVKTFAQIIRVTFPDWTFWSLPSAAVEFWNAVAQQTIRAPLDEKLRTLNPEHVKNISKTDYECLGDGYAVFTMGPAYAYCALLLTFDPTSEKDHSRARAVLAMLEWMDLREGPASRPYLNTLEQLLNAWNAARKQLGQAELVLDFKDRASADATDPDGAGTRLLMKTFAEVLSRLTSPGFVVDFWPEIQRWAKALLEDDVSNIVPRNGAELRHVFNAAWIARVHPDRDPNRDLTKTVEQLRDKVLPRGNRGN
jgi:hypothetical protein